MEKMKSRTCIFITDIMEKRGPAVLAYRKYKKALVQSLRDGTISDFQAFKSLDEGARKFAGLR